MQSFCGHCGQEAELQAAPDGGMYCSNCIYLVSNPRCIDCIKCHQRRCGDAIYACALCNYSPSSVDTGRLQPVVKKEKISSAIRVDETCERCGGAFDGPILILNGKSLCRSCVIYEQKKWEIIETKPGKSGNRIKIVFDKPKQSLKLSKENERAANSLFQKIGIDPTNLPPNPFPKVSVLSELRMPDDVCKSCMDKYARKKSKKYPSNLESSKDSRT